MVNAEMIRETFREIAVSSPVDPDLYHLLVENKDLTWQVLTESIYGTEDYDVCIGITILLDLEQSNILHFPESRTMLLDAIRTSQSEYHACAIMTILGNLLYLQGDRAIEKALLPYLLHEDVVLRGTTLGILELIPQEADLIPYLELLLNDEDEFIAEKSQEILGQLPYAHAQFTLMEWEKRKVV